MFVIRKGSSAQGGVGGVADAAANLGRSLHHHVSSTEGPPLSGRLSRLHVRQESASFQAGTAGIWELRLSRETTRSFGMGVCSTRAYAAYVSLRPLPTSSLQAIYLFAKKSATTSATRANGKIKRRGAWIWEIDSSNLNQSRRRIQFSAALGMYKKKKENFLACFAC